MDPQKISKYPKYRIEYTLNQLLDGYDGFNKDNFKKLKITKAKIIENIYNGSFPVQPAHVIDDLESRMKNKRPVVSIINNVVYINGIAQFDYGKYED